MRRPRLAAGVLLALLALSGCPDPTLGQVRPALVVDETPIDFGTLPVLNPAAHELEVRNAGGAALAFSAIEVTGADAAAFTVDEAPTSVAPSSAGVVRLTFRPDAERAFDASLALRSNDPDRPVVEIPLTGVGSTVACIEIEPASVNFGLVGEGQTAVETLTVRAGCTAPLLVEDVRFSDDTPPEFEPVGSWASGTLQVGEEIPLSVAFRPRKGQVETTGTILVTSADPDHRVVEVPLTAELNRAPIADCGEAVVAGAPGDTVSFDGGASYDPDGHEPLTFDWRVDKRPLNSLTEIPDPTAEIASLELDVAGAWEVSLGVTDALGIPSVDRCRIEVRSIPAEKLYVELVWDHAVTDLDLHFLAPGATLYGPGDCWWGNPAPDLGVLGDPADDPRLDRDDLAGFGPELMTYTDPVAGTYRIVVDFPKANGAADPTTRATVRVFEYGVIVAELSRTLDGPRTLWNVAAVDWPSGEVSPVDTVGAY